MASQPEKPRFKATQMTSATDASKHFGALCDRAKSEPQLILEHNEADSVLMSYNNFEAMYIELQALRKSRSFKSPGPTSFFC